MSKTVLIIGAGPGGLTSGLLLARAGHKVIIYESDPQQVGGLSRTVAHRGFRIDIGGHRFYTKEPEVQKFWQEALGEDLLVRKRISRIFYKKKFLKYPLRPLDLLFKLNPLESLGFVCSYLLSQFSGASSHENFERWIIRKFGKKLYLAFFKSYTEKVWGIACHEISSDWAVQRINNLNIGSLLKNFFYDLLWMRKQQIKSLIEEFEYPVYGPGMLWEKVAANIVELGGEIRFNSRVMGSRQDPQSLKWRLELMGGELSAEADQLISTAPLQEFISGIEPRPHHELFERLQEFRYRGFITVALMFKGKNPFPDNWIYIHETKVKVGRIQNYGNWSPGMVPSAEYVCLGMEYFCQKDDEFWMKTDAELFLLAQEELRQLRISFEENEIDFKVIRCPNAYPIYDMDYKKRLEDVKTYIGRFENLHLVGRNGLHRYNNQDHSIKTAMLVCENIKLSYRRYDPWNVNQDAEYIEEIKVGSGPVEALS